MTNLAFKYDLLTEKWIEIEDKNFIDTDIEKLPVVLFVEYEWLKNQKFVFCKKHHQVEKIISVNDSEIITEENCTFKGLTAVIKIPKNDSYDWKRHFTAVRRRIFQKAPQTPVNVSADVISFEYKGWHNIFLCRYENFYINVSMQKKILITKKIRRKNWTEDRNATTEIKMPEIVTEAALEVLRESTKAVHGIKPTVITNIQGVKKILAYIERPFDVNIILLKNFFSRFGDFDKIFPYDCKDNYKIICRLLEINPPKSLRKAYAKNPYAIIWYMIFKQFGVKDINFMQKFFLLDNDIIFWKLKDFIFNPKNKTIFLSDYKWRIFQYYTKWRIKNIGEKKILQMLYRLVKENLILDEMQFDIMDMFYKYDEKITSDLKKKLLKFGLTGFIHDAMSYEISEHLNKFQRVRIIYDQKIMSYEAEINGYKFRAVRDTKDLYYLGLEMSNCVMTYRDKVLSRQSIIFCVIRKAKYVACIEIQNENEIVQALGYHNQLLEDELLFVCNFWAKLKNFTIKTNQLDLPIKIFFDTKISQPNLQNLIYKIIF